jgi:hypothetical protein
MNLIQRGTTASRANRGKSVNNSIAEAGRSRGYGSFSEAILDCSGFVSPVYSATLSTASMSSTSSEYRKLVIHESADCTSRENWFNDVRATCRILGMAGQRHHNARIPVLLFTTRSHKSDTQEFSHGGFDKLPVCSVPGA